MILTREIPPVGTVPNLLIHLHGPACCFLQKVCKLGLREDGALRMTGTWLGLTPEVYDTPIRDSLASWI